jgi:hypothetical protein
LGIAPWVWVVGGGGEVAFPKVPWVSASPPRVREKTSGAQALQTTPSHLIASLKHREDKRVRDLSPLKLAHQSHGRRTA